MWTITALHGQVGGNQVYEFLTLSPSARVTALGEYVISVLDDDANLAFLNPASLTIDSKNHLNFNQNFHFSGIANGYFSYANYWKKYEIALHGGIQYINYGNFNLADEFGNISGEFGASEMAFTIGASKALNENYHVGSNFKYIFSSFESYRSSGLAIDLGGMYNRPESNFSAGFVIQNLGLQMTFYDEKREPLPFDMVAGVSKRLEHMPLRFSVIAHHLHRWNITYDDPNQENNLLFDNRFAVILDNAFRHLVFNGEFLIGKGEPIRLRVGYNHFRRRELSLSDFRSFAGFSGGLGIKSKKWRLDYGFSIYHLAGSVHHLSFGTSLDAFGKKQKL